MSTDTGISLATEWLGDPARRIEVLRPGGQWSDVAGDCRSNVVPPEVV